MVLLIISFTWATRINKNQSSNAVVISERPYLFFLNKFRQAINESEMQHYVLLILTGILAPGVNLTPVVMDPDNSVDLRKKASRIVSLHGNNRDERQRRKRRFR